MIYRSISYIYIYRHYTYIYDLYLYLYVHVYIIYIGAICLRYIGAEYLYLYLLSIARHMGLDESHLTSGPDCDDLCSTRPSSARTGLKSSPLKAYMKGVVRGGNQLTDLGLLEVLALLRQDGGHLF